MTSVVEAVLLWAALAHSGPSNSLGRRLPRPRSPRGLRQVAMNDQAIVAQLQDLPLHERQRGDQDQEFLVLVVTGVRFSQHSTPLDWNNSMIFCVVGRVQARPLL